MDFNINPLVNSIYHLNRLNIDNYEKCTTTNLIVRNNTDKTTNLKYTPQDSELRIIGLTCMPCNIVAATITCGWRRH